MTKKHTLLVVDDEPDVSDSVHDRAVAIQTRSPSVSSESTTRRSTSTSCQLRPPSTVRLVVLPKT